VKRIKKFLLPVKDKRNELPFFCLDSPETASIFLSLPVSRDRLKGFTGEDYNRVRTPFPTPKSIRKTPCGELELAAGKMVIYQHIKISGMAKTEGK